MLPLQRDLSWSVLLLPFVACLWKLEKSPPLGGLIPAGPGPGEWAIPSEEAKGGPNSKQMPPDTAHWTWQTEFELSVSPHFPPQLSTCVQGQTTQAYVGTVPHQALSIATASGNLYHSNFFAFFMSSIMICNYWFKPTEEAMYNFWTSIFFLIRKKPVLYPNIPSSLPPFSNTQLATLVFHC